MVIFLALEVAVCPLTACVAVICHMPLDKPRSAAFHIKSAKPKSFNVLLPKLILCPKGPVRLIVQVAAGTPEQVLSIIGPLARSEELKLMIVLFKSSPEGGVIVTPDRAKAALIRSLA